MVPVLATVTYLALLVALWGVTSLVLDWDVIIQSDAGPLLGPAMALAACAVTWVATRRLGSGFWAPTLASAASTYAAMLIVGGIGYTITTGEAIWFLLFVGAYATSPFVVGASVLSGLTVFAAWALTRGHRR